MLEIQYEIKFYKMRRKMPVTAELRENGHVWYYVITDPWQAKDLIALYPLDFEHRNTVDHKVHTFMNVSGMNFLPPGLLSAGNKAPAWSHPTSGQLVMVGAHKIARKVAETIFKVANYDRAKFFANEDEGWDYLREFIRAENAKQA
jgi:hypothetical protein